MRIKKNFVDSKISRIFVKIYYMEFETLGDRMKSYESQITDFVLDKQLPIVARVNHFIEKSDFVVIMLSHY